MKAFAPGSRAWRDESRLRVATRLLAVLGVILVGGIALGAWMRVIAWQAIDYGPESPLTAEAAEFTRVWRLDATTMRALMFEVMGIARLAFGWHCLQTVLLLPAWWWARRRPLPAVITSFVAWTALQLTFARFAPIDFERFRWIVAATATAWLLAFRAAWRLHAEERALAARGS